MDKIILKGITFYAYHGALPAERELGQQFTVDLELAVDLKAAAKSDSLNATFNYEKAYQVAEEVMLGETCGLLETLAERIAAKLLTNQLVTQVKVRVKKEKPPIPGKIDQVYVEIERKKEA